MNNILKIYHQYSKSIALYLLVVICFRFFGGKFLVDFYSQPLRDIQENYFYWISLLMYYPHYIIHHYWACVFVDTLTVLLPIIIFFSKKYNKWWMGVFLVFFWVQTSTVEIFSCSHSKSVICLFVAALPIIFKGRKFLLMVDFARYVGAFILVSAAYFKFANGALLKTGNYSIALINQYYDRAILNPDHLLFQIAIYIIERPWLGDILFRLLFISQIVFLLTFFTRKYDKLLIINLFMFALLSYFFMGIYNFDIFIISIPLFFSIKVKELLNN